ncbi:MAG: hypothetical protein A3E80_05670 [Chlamydiae bacterium RIFCSPHIGHO2_12_FULL_49_9]|nr:MAG: hypothetical protein A3E80_05670 [Chlamydiae bacterium RIFCSPHIGHO2_12_FULL_49_9]
MRSVARAGSARPGLADGGLPEWAGEEAGSQLASKGRFCGAKSFESWLQELKFGKKGGGR